MQFTQNVFSIILTERLTPHPSTILHQTDDICDVACTDEVQEGTPRFLDQLPLQEFISMYLADIPREEFREGIQLLRLVEDLNAFGVLIHVPASPVIIL